MHSISQSAALRCPAQHPLKYTTSLPSRYVNGNYFCDRCQGKFNLNLAPLWHCEACSYDVCMGCANSLASSPPSNKPFEKTGSSINSSSILKCDQGHPLEMLLQSPASNQHDKYRCNRCMKFKTVGVDGPDWRCQTCDYDCCQACADNPPLDHFNKSMPFPTCIGLNGALHKGNYIWAGAMNLAWNELTAINGELVDLTIDPTHQHMLTNFNSGAFTTASLLPNSYYVKAGFGQNTVVSINKECRQKFPQKSFADLKLQLDQTDVIAYAYLVKDVQYLVPFARQPHFRFINKQVRGFAAKTPEQRKNVEVLAYESHAEFIVSLRLKQSGEQLLLVVTQRQLQAHQVVQLVSASKGTQPLVKDDEFAMPELQLDVERHYEEFLDKRVKNGKLAGYELRVMVERIKFRMDEVGAKVENEAVVVAVLSCSMQQPRRLVLDRPFWVVMREKGRHPYFVAQINNTEFMKQ